MERLQSFRDPSVLIGLMMVTTGTLGFGASVAFAGQAALEADTGAQQDSAITAATDDSFQSDENTAQLRLLADLQHKQILAQRRALDGTPDNKSALAGLEFLMPTDPVALAQIVQNQQRVIETQGKMLALQSDPVIELVAPQRFASIETVGNMNEPLLGLHAEMPAQDDAARVAFDEALAAGRERIRAEQETVDDAVVVTAAATSMEQPVQPDNSASSSSALPAMPGVQLRRPTAPNSESVVSVANFEPASAQVPDQSSKLADHLPKLTEVQPSEHTAQGSGGIVDVALHRPVTPSASFEPNAKLAVNSPQPNDKSVFEVARESVHSEHDYLDSEQSVTQVAAVHGYDTLSDPELAEIRAGFVTQSGIEFNIGFDFRTEIDGALIAHNTFIMDGSESAVPTSVVSVLAGANGTNTTIVNSIGSGGLQTLLHNSQDGVSIVHTTEFTVNILNVELIETMRTAMRIGAGPGLGNIIKDALISPVAVR